FQKPSSKHLIEFISWPPSNVCVLPEKRRQALLYPFNSLEEHLSSQVRQEEFKTFNPSLEELRQAETLFTPSSKHSIDCSSSAVRLDHVPLLKHPEVCFMGRSNVGKSSLSCALFSLAPEVDVRVSKTPVSLIWYDPLL
uniref:GTP-binding protein 8 n=1 Tax=Cyprinus carpio TaxID=7962 RepID=A0A8C1VQ98_CYPCA